MERITKGGRSMTKAEIDAISERHIRGVDKWNRMYAGVASHLEKYANDIVYFKVENTEKVRPSSFETAEWIVRAWVNNNSELKQARGWVVFLYRTNVSTGFVISFNDLDKDILENAVNQMKVKRELQLVNIFSGIFN